MSFDFSTTTEAMQTAINDIQTAYGDLNGYLSTLQGILDANLPGWQGDAQSAYAGIQAQWNSDQKAMNNALDDLSLALTKAMQNYIATEEANTMH